MLSLHGLPQDQDSRGPGTALRSHQTFQGPLRSLLREAETKALERPDWLPVGFRVASSDGGQVNWLSLGLRDWLKFCLEPVEGVLEVPVSKARGMSLDSR